MILIVEPQRALIDTQLCFSVSQSGTKPIFGFTNNYIILFSTHYNFLRLLEDFAICLKNFCTFFANFCKLDKTKLFSNYIILFKPQKGFNRHSAWFLSLSVCYKTNFGFMNNYIILFSTHYNFFRLLEDFATCLKKFCTFFAIFGKLAKTKLFSILLFLLATIG